MSNIVKERVASYLYLYAVGSVLQTDLLIDDAIRLGATDIHIQPDKEGAIIKMRVSGQFIESQRIGSAQYNDINGRLKILANLRTDQKEIPQDGGFDHRKQRVRISIMPSYFGESIVLRIIESANKQILTLEEAGMDFRICKSLYKALDGRGGLTLFTGPTGSGKSTSAYGLICHFLKLGLQILTIEDPVERQLEGVRQIPIKPHLGFDYKEALRSAMRQDPDVIFVGEIRDAETLRSVMSLALTGHIVISTIHSGSVRAAIKRAVSLGADYHDLSMILRGVFNQKLFTANDKLWQSKRIAVFESLVAEEGVDLESFKPDTLSPQSNIMYLSFIDDLKNKKDLKLIKEQDNNYDL